MKPEPVNTARVRNPKWTGEDGECAVLVSRGEPRRSNVQVQQAVHDQVVLYLAEFTDREPADLVVTLAVQLIAEDHIEPVGKQGVALTREHLLAYIDAATTKLTEAGVH